jgi:hypothetical protein
MKNFEPIIPQGSQIKKAIPLVLPSTPKPSSPCSCGCTEVRAELSHNSTHYAAWRCTECGRFRGWIPKPKTLTALQAENELIRKLLDSGKLNDRELEFCQSIKGQKKLSPRQRLKLEEIAKRLGFDGQHGQIAGCGSHLHQSEGGEG